MEPACDTPRVRVFFSGDGVRRVQTTLDPPSPLSIPHRCWDVAPVPLFRVRREEHHRFALNRRYACNREIQGRYREKKKKKERKKRGKGS